MLRKLVTEESKATLIDEGDKWYNAFEEDIAVANFFFTKPTAIGEVTGRESIIFMTQFNLEYRKTENMTVIDLISQLGGLFGLCLGFSFISFIEIFYWISIRLCRNIVKGQSDL